MASIELRDANMNELQLADGTFATLRFNIPLAMQAEAPQTIDWWSFDETLGYWKHEGEAQKTGTQYVGAASHFSWWNVDVPQNFNDFNGAINTVGGTPVSDAQINVISPTMGTGITYTNAEGTFTCRVPKNQALTLNVNLLCSTTNDWTLAHSETINSATQPISSAINANLEGRFPITGTVTNCQNQPVESGYVRMGHQIFITNQGEFTIQTCAIGNYIIRGYDTSIPDSIKVSELISVQVESSGAATGNILACTELFGAVTDIDGNVYPTVLIGNQFWMAENLKTTRFADGSVIPNVTDTTAWTQLSTPAWCNYNNSLANDIIYGKMYNWFTVSDPRNVCPAGWHAPTDAEWTILTDFLGGLSVAGGKMKATTGWQSQNTGATNESNFSGLPGGYRFNNNGAFAFVGGIGAYWSSSENDSGSAWHLYLFFDNGNANRFNTNKPDGLSVRCLRD